MKRMLRKFWHYRYRIVLLLVVAGVACLAICDWHVASASDGLVYSNIVDTPSRPVALVLGTAKYLKNGRRNLFYVHRIEAAAQLYEAGKVRAIVVSGDNGRVEYDEPSQMKADLVELGVPAEFITCDYAGFSTLDSIHRAERVFQEPDYIVVSQEFHVRRALFIAADRGHNAVGYAVSTPGGFFGAKVRLREVLARVKAVLQVHALGSGPKYLGRLEDVQKRPI